MLQNRLEQLEKEAQHQREKEEDLRRKIRRRRELEDKLIKLEADVKTKASRSTPEDNARKEQDPFTKEIMKTKIPKDFKLLDMTLYEGTTDPGHHLSNFRSRMYLTDTSDAVHCKAFPTTLTKTTIRWFDNLPPRSISSFDDMAKKFLARFSIQKDKAKHAPSLLESDKENGKPCTTTWKDSTRHAWTYRTCQQKPILWASLMAYEKGPLVNPYQRNTPHL